MNVMGISVYFIVILVGVLLGLVIGLSILSFVQNRKEKKKYKRVMQEALGFEDGVKKIRKRKEKEEKRRLKKEERRLAKERRKAEAETDEEISDPLSAEDGFDSEYESDFNSAEAEVSEADAASEDKPKSGGLFGRRKNKAEGVLAGRVRNPESYSEMLCDGDGEDSAEIIHGKLRTQDDKYRIKHRKDKETS